MVSVIQWPPDRDTYHVPKLLRMAWDVVVPPLPELKEARKQWYSQMRFPYDQL